MLISAAQNGEDIVLFRAFGEIGSGTFVDVGAADPDVDNVTKVFYDRGWSGMNVEPLAEHFDRLCTERERDINLQVCAGSEAGKVILHAVAGTGLSSVVDDVARAAADAGREVVDYECEMHRLDTLLAAHCFADRPIHFLKIDVEGFERQVLDGIDLRSWRPWVVVVESTFPNTQRQDHEAWESILESAGYHCTLFDGLNRFFVAKEHQELASKLSYPVCVFDQPYLMPNHAALLDEFRQLETNAETLLKEHRASLAAFDLHVAEYQRTLEAYERLETEYHRTVDSYGALEQKSQRFEAMFAAATADIDRTLTLLQDTEESIGLQRAEIAKLHDICSDLQHERDQLSLKCADLTQELTVSRSVAAARLAEREAIESSTAWRLTTPVRRIADRVRRR